MNRLPVSPHYLARAKQRERLAKAAYIAARNEAVRLGRVGGMSPRRKDGLRFGFVEIENALYHALEMREWYFIAVRHRKMCESRGTTPFGGRISPNAIARHNEKHRK